MYKFTIITFDILQVMFHQNLVKQMKEEVAKTALHQLVSLLAPVMLSSN